MADPVKPRNNQSMSPARSPFLRLRLIFHSNGINPKNHQKLRRTLRSSFQLYQASRLGSIFPQMYRRKGKSSHRGWIWVLHSWSLNLRNVWVGRTKMGIVSCWFSLRNKQSSNWSKNRSVNWHLPDNGFFEYLKSLSPSSTDVEIRSLISLDHLTTFLRALTQRLKSHKDFEAVQAFLSVFLTVHGDVLIANPEMNEVLKELKSVQARESGRLGELISYSLGTLGFLRSN